MHRYRGAIERQGAACRTIANVDQVALSRNLICMGFSSGDWWGRGPPKLMKHGISSLAIRCPSPASSDHQADIFMCPYFYVPGTAVGPHKCGD